MSTEKLIVMMSAKEADTLISKINTNISQAGAWLLDFRDRQGWKAKGYDSFKDACAKEFADLYGGRSQIYRLMQQAEVAANVSPIGDTHKLGTGVSRELAKLPASEQKPALDEAKAKSGGKTPTAAAVKEAVEKRTPAKPEPKKSSPAPPAKSNAAHDKALERIGKVCGGKVSDAIRKGVIKLPEREVLFFAKLKDSQMADIQELVVGGRWMPSKAHAFRTKMIGPKTKIEELISHCIAEGGTLEAVVSGYTIIVKAKRK